MKTDERGGDDAPAYGIRSGAEEFPLMVVLSIIYPCNFGCPNCPYTDANSQIRKFYHERKGDFMPESLWQKIATEAGPYQAWLRCTGGGEPMMHPRMTEMVEFAKERGARVWMNTNGSMFGPDRKGRERLERLIQAGVDLIEFSMDAGDAESYAIVRPPIGGPPKDPDRWFENHLGNVRAALAFRGVLKATTRVVVSMIRQQTIADKLDRFVDFWRNVGVDEVITRKFLSWDDNTSIDLERSSDRFLYQDLPEEKREPCVWPFERLNVDTLGRVALCGQDVSFRTAEQFPTVHETSIRQIWRGERFNWYRRMHLEGTGAQCWPCRGCSAWLAGVRDWNHGWLKVLKNSARHVTQALGSDPGAEVDVYTPLVADARGHPDSH